MKKFFVFLDFDNTMMATEQYAVPSLIARFNMLYGDQLKSPLTFEEFKKHFHGQARETLCANLSAHFGITVDFPTLYDAREERMMDYLSQVKGGIPMAPNLIETLNGLVAQGAVLSFVSNNPVQRGLASMRFADNGRGDELARLFGTRFFEAGGIQKPKPDVYIRAMAQVGATVENSFAVEDSVTGATSSVAAGIRTFAFTGFADDAPALAEKLIAKGCVSAFHDWKDFPALVLETLKAA